MAAMVAKVYGSHGGHFNVGGARLQAALYNRSVSLLLILQGRLCTACQACIALTLLMTVYEAYNTAK